MTTFATPRYPLIVLWCHPRSMSTATERIMRERGDLRCFHEPLMYHYYVERSERTMPHFEADPEQPRDFISIWKMLFAAADEQPVFTKEMAYYVWPAIQRYPDLTASVKHVFLIRDPRRSILSYYRLDANVTCEEIGYEALWRTAEWVATTTGRRPPILEAEVIQSTPRRAMQSLWRTLELSDCPEALTWSDDVPEEWQQVSGWHEGAIQSRGIEPVKNNDDVQRTFDDAAAAAPHLREFLAHHTPFYQQLRHWSGATDAMTGDVGAIT